MTKRILAAVGLIVLTFGSLITFPAYIHWMVTLWVVLSLVAFIRRRSTWPWLVGCVSIVAIKCPGFTPEFWLLTSVFILVALVDRQTNRDRNESRKTEWLAIYAVVLISTTATYGVTRWLAANTSRQVTPDLRPIGRSHIRGCHALACVGMPDKTY